MASSIWDDLKSRQEAIASALSESLQRVCVDTPAPLVEAMEYCLLAPGKRLRPLLTMLACEAVGGEPAQSLPAGAAIEMIHTYSLIHDDLPAMDDDDLRRGLPTCHRKYGEALAILVGDALLAAAFELISSRYNAATAAVMTLEMARAAGPAGMVGGQVLDLIGDGRITGEVPATRGHLENLHNRKTGAMFRAALRNGIHAATNGVATPARQEQLASVDQYAAGFGLAFQITDDLLDIESSAEKTGKRVGKDAHRGKRTYPALLGVAESRRAAEQQVDLAIQAATRFGSAGRPLVELAHYLLTRDR
ncbi:MAG: polyprenyl synthetase family protein [Bacteroidales bacterium]|nr:polyprenyl synthetase family protein [Bacteroidales bacterium]